MEQAGHLQIRSSTLSVRHDLPIIITLFLLTLALYWRGGRFDFTNFDDGGYIAGASHVQAGLRWESIGWAFTTRAMNNWHPLTWISYMADATFFHARPGAMHLENAIIHSINAALLFILLQMMTGRRWAGAWVAGMFAWHPLHVESVAWISERKDVLSTLFMFLSMIGYVRYVYRPGLATYSISLAMLILGLLCKPMIVTLPCVLLLLDFWPLRRLSDPATAPPRVLWRSKRNALIIEKLPMFFIAALGGAAAYWAQSTGHAVASTGTIPMKLRLDNAVVTYVKYLQQTVVPSGLALFYPHPGVLQGGHIPTANLALCAGILLVLSLIAITSRRAMPWILIGWLWYLGTLVPVIGLVQAGSQSRADRYTYTPLIGIFLAVGWSADKFARENALRKTLIGALGGALCAAAMIVSWRQIGYWRDSVTVLRHAIDVVPDNYLAHSNLGEAYDADHDVENAEREYQKVLQIRPDDPVALADLADHAADRGEIQRAMELYQLSFRGDPDSAAIYNNYANFLSNIGRGDEAVQAFKRAMALNLLDKPQIYHNFALALAKQGKVNEAIPLWQKAVQLKPDYTAAHFGLAQALILARRDREAIAEFKAALTTAPDRIDILANLAWVLATDSLPEIRDGAEALRLAQHACNLSHNSDAICLDSLAAAQARVGRFQVAVQTAHLAADAAARQNLTELSQQIAHRISLYEKGEPYTSGN